MVYILRLFVKGKTANSERAIKNLREILSSGDFETGEYKLEVVDILKNPQLAEDEKIIATPVLEKKLPLPIRRVIGDLSNKEKVLLGLDLVKHDKSQIKENEK